MKSRPADIEREARELFREAVADAVPLASDRAPLAPPPRPALPRQRRRDEAEALRESLHRPAPLDLRLEGGDEPNFLRPGLPKTVLRDLRRGRWVIQAQLDLHGCTREGAHVQVGDFLAACLARRLRCVRIIHGKGLRSPGREPVLKGHVQGWLARKGEVLAYCQARPHEGGSGALIVLLKG